MMEDGYKYSEITGRIIGCSMAVHSAIGNGFPEIIYQRALKIEFEEREIQFVSEYSQPIFYKSKNIGSRRVDFLVEDKIPVEIKATTILEPHHISQALNYLEAYNLEIGLLINFGEASLKFKRLINKKYKSE